MMPAPDGYGDQLGKLQPWNEMFDVILARHGLDESAPRRMGRAGTFPTAVIGDAIVKVSPEFLFGPQCYETEVVAYKLLAKAGDLPVPRLLVAGNVFEPGDTWHWPYVVLTVVDGADLSSCKSDLSQQSWNNLANWLGVVVKRLHAIEHKHDWSDFVAFIQDQRAVAVDRHRKWASLPTHLIDEIDSWLPSMDELIDKSVSPVFVHADIHEDHIFGTVNGNQFTPTGIINFGDVAFAPPTFELPALHLGTFHGDKHLLKTFLDVSEMRFDARTAMAFTLLFEFDVLEAVERPADMTSLDELTTWLYDISDISESKL